MTPEEERRTNAVTTKLTGEPRYKVVYADIGKEYLVYDTIGDGGMVYHNASRAIAAAVASNLNGEDLE